MLRGSVNLTTCAGRVIFRFSKPSKIPTGPIRRDVIVDTLHTYHVEARPHCQCGKCLDSPDRHAPGLAYHRNHSHLFPIHRLLRPRSWTARTVPWISMGSPITPCEAIDCPFSKVAAPSWWNGPNTDDSVGKTSIAWAEFNISTSADIPKTSESRIISCLSGVHVCPTYIRWHCPRNETCCSIELCMVFSFVLP